MRSSRSILGVLSSLTLLSACSTTPSLYSWGPYEDQTYSFFKNESFEQSIPKLEEHASKSQNRGERLPPGFWAHLGLLYNASGQVDKATEMFLMEKSLFPESAHYMDFLMKGLKK
jgi:hypothetical protein